LAGNWAHNSLQVGQHYEPHSFYRNGYRFSRQQLKDVEAMIDEHELVAAWQSHFGN
jgi:hypothetical protein